MVHNVTHCWTNFFVHILPKSMCSLCLEILRPKKIGENVSVMKTLHEMVRLYFLKLASEREELSNVAAFYNPQSCFINSQRFIGIFAFNVCLLTCSSSFGSLHESALITSSILYKYASCQNKNYRFYPHHMSIHVSAFLMSGRSSER